MSKSVSDYLEKTRSESKREKILGWVAAAVGFCIGKYFGILVFTIFAASCIIGYYFARLLYKKNKLQIKLVKFIIWSNILTWTLPPLGLITSVFTIQIGEYDMNQKIKCRILGISSCCLALISAVVGMLTYQ